MFHDPSSWGIPTDACTCASSDDWLNEDPMSSPCSSSRTMSSLLCTQMSGQSSHMLMPAMTAITSQLSRIGQMAAALVAEQCYQEGVCAGDIPMQPPKTLDELESMMENALLQCSTLSQQHQDVASQLANTKLELANLQEEVIILRHQLSRSSATGNNGA